MAKIEFQLFGAKNFSAYLRKTQKGKLTAEAIEGQGTGEYSFFDYETQEVKRGEVKAWVVKLDDESIGEYRIFDYVPQKTDFHRQYRGRIPGYVNPLTEKEDVVLIYSEERVSEGRVITPVNWKRNDGHGQIPFP